MSKLAHTCAAYSSLRPLRLRIWNELVKRTIARFARGNIAAQNQRILLPDEQQAEHKSSKKIARRWQKRYKPS